MTSKPPAGATALQQIGAAKLDLKSVRGRVLPRHRDRLLGDVHGLDVPSGSPVLDGQRQRPRPRTHVDDGQRRLLRTVLKDPVHEQLRVRAGDEHPSVHDELEIEGMKAAAPSMYATGSREPPSHQRPKPGPRLRGKQFVEAHVQVHARAAEGVGEQMLRVGASVRDPEGLELLRGPLQQLAHGPTGVAVFARGARHSRVTPSKTTKSVRL